MVHAMKPLLLFFALAYLISWIIWLPLYGHVFGLANLPTFTYNHGLGGLGPLLAASITTGIFQGRQGMQQLIAKCIQFRPIIYLFIALLSPFLLAFLAACISHFVDGMPIQMQGLGTTKEYPEFSFLLFFFFNLIFFGFGEEVGWRGFALPRFQNKFNALVSTLFLTVFWAAWHLPLFFYRPGYAAMGMGGITGWILSLLTGSILLTWMYNSSRASILICAVFHATIDISFTADFSNPDIVQYMGVLITIWGILTILIFKPRNLSNIPKSTLKE
jgi:uncharacterized protein